MGKSAALDCYTELSLPSLSCLPPCTMVIVLSDIFKWPCILRGACLQGGQDENKQMVKQDPFLIPARDSHWPSYLLIFPNSGMGGGICMVLQTDTQIDFSYAKEEALLAMPSVPWSLPSGAVARNAS